MAQKVEKYNSYVWAIPGGNLINRFLKKKPKMISLEKLYILTSLQKLPENVRDLDKLIVVKGFK